MELTVAEVYQMGITARTVAHKLRGAACQLYPELRQTP